jgi:hypothetical protein
MSASGLYRWAGYSGVVSAILLIVGNSLHPAALTAGSRAVWEMAHELIFCSIVLAIPAFFAIYARQAQEIGRSGLLGFVLAFIGTMGFGGVVWFEAFVSPALVGDPTVYAAIEGLQTGSTPSMIIPFFLVTVVAFSPGWLLLGWATARAGIFPRAAGYLVLLGGVFFGLGPLLFASMQILDKLAGAIFGIGLLWLSWNLTMERRMVIAAAPS